tara:strand:+ start:22 stop:1329 length:1308 start_codon:yes stop_codon:yes gene_type:complete
MITLGISEGFHNSSVCYVEDGEILFASESERYTGTKNAKWVPGDLLQLYECDNMVYYEKPFKKNIRRLLAGQSWEKTRFKYDNYYSHHLSHAAAGYYTAPFKECNILVIDAIGEWETITIWDNLKKVRSWSYPYSLGLLYSAVTQYLGFKPNEEEYIVMGMSAFGEPIYNYEYLLYENNHRGIKSLEGKPEDIAASIQKLYEDELLKLVKMCPKKNLILMGGCALNCVANSKIKGKNIWIMPSPGDAGSSLGASALKQGKINWEHPYLGYDISRHINPKEVVDDLLENKIVGVANGRAEFGPRALGNRSLLGDPRYDIKDTVNAIKKRQKFRPFAPAILEEFADEYFEGPMNRYMQFVANAKHDYKSVTHVDNTARVQVVEKDCKSVIRPILEEFYEKTKVPMLLNTSLNIKGKPMVNTEKDANKFTERYDINVW